jgi:hypothetical protein
MAKLPTRVRFPFGYVVKVSKVKKLAMDGEWGVDKRTIKIKKGLSPKRELYVFLHEMRHAQIDWEHWVLDGHELSPD